MNRIIIFSMAILLALPLPAANRYSVYNTKGIVRIFLKAKNVWEDIPNKCELQLGDLLQLGENSSIIIMDKSNNLLYTYEIPGECTVIDAVHNVQKIAGSRTKAVNSEMMRRIAKHGSHLCSSEIGASFRSPEEKGYIDSLAVLLRWVAHQKKDNSLLSLSIEDNGNESFFNICNNSNVPLYINILNIKGEYLKVCLEFDGKDGVEGIVLDSGSSVLLDQYPFLFQEGSRYFIFGTERSYDTRSLQRALQYKGEEGYPLTSGYVF